MFLTGGLCPDASPQLPIQIRFCDKCESKPSTWPSSASSRLTGVFWVAAEDAVLSAVISYTNSSTVHFRLSPAYILYAAGRFALRQQRKQGSQGKGQPHGATRITNKMVAMMRRDIQARDQKIDRKSKRFEFLIVHSSSSVSIFALQDQQAIAGALAFWMANSSELLNFLKQDKELSLLTRQSQLDLTQLVHGAYRYAQIQHKLSASVEQLSARLICVWLPVVVCCSVCRAS